MTVIVASPSATPTGTLIRDYAAWREVDVSFQNFDPRIADLSAHIRAADRRVAAGLRRGLVDATVLRGRGRLQKVCRAEANRRGAVVAGIERQGLA